MSGSYSIVLKAPSSTHISGTGKENLSEGKALGISD
jgi:hypothetical protein